MRPSIGNYISQMVGEPTPPGGQSGNVSIESACREIPSIPFDICEMAILDPGKAYSLIADIRRRSHQGDPRCSAPRRVSRDTVVCDRHQFPSELRRDSRGLRPFRRPPFRDLILFGPVQKVRSIFNAVTRDDILKLDKTGNSTSCHWERMRLASSIVPWFIALILVYAFRRWRFMTFDIYIRFSGISHA